MTASPYETPGQDVLWAPHAGPQSSFLASPAYEVLYGGQAGGGKSDALLFGGLRQVDHPQYKALILRRTFPELRELIDRSLAVFPQLGGVWNQQDHRWRFPTGATYEFGYCDTYADVMKYQGQQYTWIGYDEIGQLAEERIWLYLMSRNRAAAPGLVRMMRCSANPGGPGHAWLKRRFIARCPSDGTVVSIAPDKGESKIGITRAFVKSTLRDNPTLMELDPEYESRLAMLPELEYRWLAMGDWDAGAGLALSELARDKHLVRHSLTIQAHWTVFGAFDWGYQHPFAFGLFVVDDQGQITMIDSTHGRHLQPPEIALRVRDVCERNGVPVSRLRYVTAGHDCWADHKARGERVPTIAEQMAAEGLRLIRANISRIAGVQNFRRYLRWKHRDALDVAEKEITPRFQILDTLSNRRVFDCLETRVSDPDEPEDILKTDADDRGEGGDDSYDMVRYGLASRPLVAALKPPTAEQKRDHRAPMIDFANSKGTLRVVTADDDLAQAFGQTGRPKGASPFTHRVPTWRKSA